MAEYDKLSKFLHNNDKDKAGAKTIAIPQVFSENCRAENYRIITFKKIQRHYKSNVVKKMKFPLCYVHTQLFLALYMCVFIFGFPCGYL